MFGLSRELEWRGIAVDFVLPKYDCLRYDRVCELTAAYRDLWGRRSRGVAGVGRVPA